MQLPSRSAQLCCEWTVSHLPTCITKLTKKGACTQRMFTQCWRHAGKLQYKHSSHTSVMHLGADAMLASTQTHTYSQQADWVHIVIVGRLISSTRCVCDRPGLSRWRWGIEEALGRENRAEKHTAQHITYPQQDTDTLQPSHPASSIQRGRHIKLQNVPKQEKFELKQHSAFNQGSSYFYHWLMCQLLYWFSSL